MDCNELAGGIVSASTHVCLYIRPGTRRRGRVCCSSAEYRRDGATPGRQWADVYVTIIIIVIIVIAVVVLALCYVIRQRRSRARVHR